MKKILKYSLIFLISVLFFSCEKPLPTELISTEEVIDFQPISSDTSIVSTNDYDSTGITSSVIKYSSVVSLSYSKITTQSMDITTNLAQAYFFDKNEPVNIHSGKTIAYKTKTVGTVRFGKRKARLTEYKLKFKDRGAVKDTLLGQYYILYKRGNSGDPFNFVHDSMMDFDVKPEKGASFQTEIPTPKEINAELRVSGSRGKNNLEFTLTWNKLEQDTIEIVMGGMYKITQAVFPYISFRIPDNNGKVKIPYSFIKNFPFDKYSKIEFSLIRRKVKIIESDDILGKSYIAAQSIHRIQVDIPK